MAAARSKTQPIGSSQWIQTEREQAAQFIDQEVEEFSFSVRNELEWLNEHMGDIFSKSQVNFADVFKTPGKLRGKTPRTARKRDALAPRAPLTDIFAPNVQAAASPAKNTAFHEKVTHFQIAEDAENQPPQHRPISRGKSPMRAGKPNTDSGYHTVDENEMDIELADAPSQPSPEQPQKAPIRDDQPAPQRLRDAQSEERRITDESFVSAKEGFASRHQSHENLHEDENDNATIPDDEMEVDPVPEARDDEMEVEESPAHPQVQDENVDEDKENYEPDPLDEDLDENTSHSPSDASSPVKPLLRKSSLTFASLPAREPLTAKRSIGGRNSQITSGPGRNSVLASKSLGGGQQIDVEHSQETSEEAKVHSKSSTQSLHERIAMLGKTKEPRTSKSIPHSLLNAQTAYSQLQTTEAEEQKTANQGPQVPAKDIPKAATTVEDEDDDWIAPVKHASAKNVTQTLEQRAPAEIRKEGSPVRPGALHQKSLSTMTITSPSKAATAMESMHKKAVSVSNPSLAHASGEMQSTTPVGSPAGRRMQPDGPLSASKNKLYSVFKSAKNIFASSASASAAAKLEVHSPAVTRQQNRDIASESVASSMPGALYPDIADAAQRAGRPPSVISASPSKAEGRKTRSSSENEKKRQKEAKEQQKSVDELEKARDKERSKAAAQKVEREQAEEAHKVKEKQDEMPPPPPPKSMLHGGKLRAPGRLVKPASEISKTRPAPVSIRVASQSQRLGQLPSGTTSFSSSQQESMAPPPPKQLRPASVMRSASTASNSRSSTVPNNARVKALEAAARKKEQEEKAAQRKADQKRELEQKRAAKAEEERRVQQEKRAAEQQRVQEAKLAAQKQAADQKRREQQRLEQQRLEQQRLEQQRLEQQRQEEARKAKAAHELAEAIQRERAQAAPHPRGDVGGTLRQLAKNNMMPQPQPNPAKPPKRAMQHEDDEPAPQRPGFQRGPPSYQQHENKRRKTNEEDDDPNERHSVMAPPKRPSNMRKESTLSKFPHGYTHAPPPANHHTASMFKATVTAQHQLQHGPKAAPFHPNDMVKLSTARIPFAENANPPASLSGQSQMHPGYENKYKTPGRPAQAPKSAKSSPLYPNGDSIALPEIQTDSEDEDSEDDDNTGFRAPSWVASPALRDLLTQQQLVDPESVFGPIGELKMDEVFKNGKNQERLKRFRDRGSSAAWIESGDAVTSAEKRKDMEAREKVVREGGWRYEPGA